jgi:RNA polymerase sigma factor (sigma-70 family)
MDLRRQPRRLATTRWSIIARAASSSEDRQRALATLCELYWYPLYSFARRAGHHAEDAAELTQEFLTRFLERRDVEKTSPTRGRFRAYLLAAMRNFLANEWRASQAHKRAAAAPAIAIDAAFAESRYAAEPAAIADPERLYLRRFAMTLLDAALAELEVECRRAGKAALFGALRPLLTGEPEPGEHQRIADELDMSASAVKVAAHRLKRRFREVIRAQLADTLEDERDLDEELRTLMAAL